MSPVIGPDRRSRRPLSFVLTADLDWASEYCVEDFLAIAGRYGIEPTLFVTHRSAAARKAGRAGRAELAIHPNFLAGSTHGADTNAVIEHALRLVPEARAVRCHRYIAGRGAEERLADRGIRLDSNACRHLEAGLQPERLASGLLRLPVFFEDDVHWSQGRSWNYRDLAADFLGPGLKVLNFHPFFVALNVPDAAYYARNRPHIRTLTENQARTVRFGGAGARTFLIEAIEAILSAGHRFVPLGRLVEENPGWQALPQRDARVAATV